MITTKANAKENLEEFICLSILKAKAKSNMQIFIFVIVFVQMVLFWHFFLDPLLVSHDDL